MEISRNQAGLRRLVARHPSLAQDPDVTRLLSKGIDLEDEDILNVSQELLLRPDLTVATAGCFRHLLPQMVMNLVDVMRQRHLKRTLSDHDEEVVENVSSMWNLQVHENISMAFSRILELAPYVLSTLLQYFSFAPSPFERLICGVPAAQEKLKAAPHLLDIVRATYRFVQLEPTSFEGIWDWSPFLDLLLWSDTGLEGDTLSQITADVRWCAVQILSIITRMSDEATRVFSLRISCLTEEMAFACLLRWEEFCQEIAIEKAGWFVEPPFQQGDYFTPLVGAASSTLKSAPITEDQQQVKWKRQTSNEITHVEICGIELPVRKDATSTVSLSPSLGNSLVLTSTVKNNLKAVVLALSQREPVLLEGPVGVGKTSLIQELGRFTGNSDAIFIHLDDQMDSKTLLGTYVCTEIPGDFRWQPGALTQAVLKGLWVVFEDIDRAPFEILSALVPLLEDRKLYIAGRAETIVAAEGFQLLATVAKTNLGLASPAPGWEFLNNLWRKVVIDAPGDDELGAIIQSSFPVLTPIIPKLIGTFKVVNGFVSQLSPIDTFSGRRISFGRQFSMRDLLKWCKRLMNLKEIGVSFLSTSVGEVIYKEAVDCFAGCIACAESRRLVSEAIARLWDITEDQVHFFETLNKPLLENLPNFVQVGRACLPVQPVKERNKSGRLFASTASAMRNLERIAVCCQQQEPVLLVGETGTGKTTLVQHLAEHLSIPLTVMNLSQQSDSADFLGGFKPVEAQSLCMSLLERFTGLFCRSFPSQQNSEFLVRIHQFAEKKKLKNLLRAFGTAVTKVKSLSGSLKNCDIPGTHEFRSEPTTKRRRPLSPELMNEWNLFSSELRKCERQVEASESTFAFSYVEGAFVKAFRHGHWILLDELNLAPVETLQRLTGVLDGEKGSLILTERGDVHNIPRHPNFRVFACMNPATDIGKHDLPLSLKNRFTEFHIDELTNTEDLHSFVYRYLEGSMPCPPVGDIVNFYKQAQQEADTRLFDGANQKPRYSLRSLAWALEYTLSAMPLYGFSRALYDGICMTFLTLLDRPSSAIMENLISSWLLKHQLVSKAESLPGKVPRQPSPNHVLFEQFWIESGGFKASKHSLEFTEKYVLTRSIREHLKNVARAVFLRRYPVLLQGPTSSGKTSLIEYLATITGHRFVRINNHEHTDLQEYLGTYVTDAYGKLVFQEGILVEAVRNGYWIVLDELNLAPSDVLEALNRLLDDNREIFVPELQSMVKPHPQFMLFATQNPPGVYGGRKFLSRAFRNRFLEIHVDDIPEDELCSILEKRCDIPGSYAQKMVAVMRDLRRNRQSSQAFAGKHGYITPRDLFKWADRHKKAGISYDDLAKIGYILLAERLRDASERLVVQEALERNLRVKINIKSLYEELSTTLQMEEVKKLLASPNVTAALGKIVWTKSMRRLFSLVEHCYEHNEPMVLVGETGCGKTTVCQLLAMVYDQRLHILNCHQHTETADFLGGFRPIRERESIALQFENTVNKINTFKLFQEYHGTKLSPGIEDAEITISTLGKVLATIKFEKLNGPSGQAENNNKTQSELQYFESIQKELLQLWKDWQSLFLWQDGPLVESMRNGDLLLVDEISLADDSVLERLNSVLEPKHLLVLAEKGGSNVEEIVAHPKFLLVATMNPGGDFGKKELSPALRNRFTEIWVPPITDKEDLTSIIISRFSRACLAPLVEPVLNFWEWFQQQHVGRCLTVRDLLSWIAFINTVEKTIGMYQAFIHGAYLVLLDGINLVMGLSNESARALKRSALEFLLQQLPQDSKLEPADFEESTMLSTKTLSVIDSVVGIHPFFIQKGYREPNKLAYELMAPTTGINTFRILRAMQLRKPVLIEGSPGVGKTSLIAALANVSGHSLVRINLSEQTDMMDLLGSDLPVEGLQRAEFRWSDGVFLQALRAGSWVVLDELNLASQSVLEGLNACLDHRSEVYIPELGRTYKCPPTFRIFACQNPAHQGGGRKGLPKSFLNRFTKVYVDTLLEEDFLFISNSLYPSIPKHHLQKLIHFNNRIYEDTMVSHAYGHSGAPWEFNLRDVLRSCSLIEEFKYKDEKNLDSSISFLEVVYLQRMRSAEDRLNVLKVYEDVFGSPAAIEAFPLISLDAECLRVGNIGLKRASGIQSSQSNDDLTFLPGEVKCLESVMHCVQHGWMSILVGPPACGKTSLIRVLAKLTGNPLQEFTLSSGTDTTELLGCFEQSDLFRSWQELVKKVNHLLQMTCSLCATISDRFSTTKILSSMKTLLEGWSTFQKLLNVRCQGSGFSSTCMQQNLDSNILDPVVMESLSNVLEQVECTVCTFGAPNMRTTLDIKDLRNELIRLKRKVNQKGNLGQFEWVDGGVLKAVERGEWVLLENANLCNPTVLDRLNPLLEPNGTILINERGLVNGDAMVIRAHPNFRLFLTVDPSQGEVSRAMRNRGVEIYVMEPYWLLKEIDASLITPSQLDEIRVGTQDTRRYLANLGLPSAALVDAMCKAHTEMKVLSNASLMGYRISLREISHWVQLFSRLFERGFGLLWSLSCSWEQIYVRSLGNVEARVASIGIFNSHFSEQTISSMCRSKETLRLPGGWPSTLNLNKLSRMSMETIVMWDCMHLELLTGEQVAFQILSHWCQFVKTTNVRDSLYTWILEKKDIATMFPAFLFYFFVHPSAANLQSEEKELDMMTFDRILLYAGLWMMEQSHNTSDVRLRLVWLRNLSRKVGFYCYSLKLLCKVVEREVEHAASKEILSQLDSIKPSKIEELQLDMVVQPMDQGFAFKYTQSRMGVLLAKKLCGIRRTLLQWQIEDDAFAQVENIGFSRAEPWIVQSLRHQAGQLPRKVGLIVENDLVSCLYPLLESVRNLEEEVLMCSNPAWNDQMDELYFQFLECHKSFWKVVYEAHIVSHLLLYSCKKLKQSALVLISNFVEPKNKLKEAIDQLLLTGQRMDAALAEESDFLKPYLWKYGGHPHTPNSKELFDQLQCIVKFCHGVWPGSFHGTGDGEALEVVTSANFRRLSMEGVSMAMWVIQGLWKENQVTSTQRSVASGQILETKDILKRLRERLDAEKVSMAKMQKDDWLPCFTVTSFPLGSGTARNCKCSPPHCLEDTYHPEVLLQATRQCSLLMVLPWLDSLSLSWDADVLTDVSHMVGTFASNGGTDVAAKEMLETQTMLLEVIKFSLKFSSRSPLDFVPHQQLLWLMNANAGGELDTRTFASQSQNIAHQIWFNWHAAAWKKPAEYDLGQFSYLWNATSGPTQLFQASASTRLSNLIMQGVKVKEYYAKIVLLRLAANVLLNSSRKRKHNIFESDFQRASSLFKQIVFSFAKSFRKADFMEMKSLLSTLHHGELEGDLAQRKGTVQRIKLFLETSNHLRFSGLVDLYMLPCMTLLYVDWSPKLNHADLLSMHGKIWLHLGNIRLRLMLPSKALDPVAKYADEHFFLSEELSESRLELQVRQESNFIVRGGVTMTKFSELYLKTKELEQDVENTALKIVYRPQPSRFLAFYKEVDGFIGSLGGAYSVFSWNNVLGSTVEKANIEQIVEEVLQFQEIATGFISRISTDYPEYRDLAQPVQLSVFELKLGLSLMLSAWLQKTLKVQGTELSDTICHLVEFPSRVSSGSVNSSTMMEKGSVSLSQPVSEWLENGFIKKAMEMAEPLFSDGRDKEGAVAQLMIKIFQYALAHVRMEIMHAGFLRGSSVKVATKLLKSIAVHWKEMRDCMDARKAKETALIQFKHRTHTLDLELDQDEDSFKSMFPEYLRASEVKSKDLDHTNENEAAVEDLVKAEVSDRDWIFFEDILSREVAYFQSQTFGVYGTLYWNGESMPIPDDQRLDAFSIAYDAGKVMLEVAGHLMPESVNKRLIPAHLLRLCLEHESLVSCSAEEGKRKPFNIYEDPNALEIASVLKPLAVLQERISALLVEWPEQPILLQLTRIIQSLLTMSLNAPIMKALLGIEHLLAKAQLWEENVPKHLSISDELNGLAHLVLRWRKLELEYWPVLLRKVELQFELDAEKLWLPLHEVLHRSAEMDLDPELEPTISSLEEFMQTAPLGEYKRRLQIIYGYFGQFHAQINAESPPCGLSSAVVRRLSRILYNMFKYFSQFVPLIEELIISGKSSIMKELEDFTKLCKWDDRSYFTLVSSGEKTHRKVYKLVSKYKDVLRRPVLEDLHQNVQLKGSGNLLEQVESPSSVQQCGMEKSRGQYTEAWQIFLEGKLQKLVGFTVNNHVSPNLCNKHLSSLLPRFWSLLNSGVFAEPASQARLRGTAVLEDLGETVIVRADELRKGEKNRMLKKKALIDLLKALREIGLSHHRSSIAKEERSPKSWFEQPPSEVDSVLGFCPQMFADEDFKSGNASFVFTQMQQSSYLWKRATDYYFRNMALLEHLRESSLNFNKDLSLQEVAASTAYTEHLLYAQRRQRCLAYEFSLKLVALQNITNHVGSFGKLDAATEIGQQSELRKWMWSQKDLLDSLCNSCSETLVYYGMVYTVQGCPSHSTPPKVAIVNDALERVSATLICCKNKLDSLLVPGIQLLSISDPQSSWPVLITPNMEKMLTENFLSILDAKCTLDNECCGGGGDASESGQALNPLCELLCRGLDMFEDFKEQCLETLHDHAEDMEDFEKHYDRVVSEVLISVQSLNRLRTRLDVVTSLNQNDGGICGTMVKADTIQAWASAIEDQMSALRLEHIHHAALATIGVAVKFFDGRREEDSAKICKELHCLHELMKFIIAAGLLILCDYVALHKSQSKLGYILSSIFSSLFQEGFCAKQEDAEEDRASNVHDAFGTGMGEGEGKTDISHEIEDEDQLLGSSQKGEKEDDASQDKSRSTEKGIEMEQDFDGDMFDVSQSESDETGEENDHDQQLESKMGETGECEDIVDEKLWGKEDDDNGVESQKEKYESGAPLQDAGEELELRAKEIGMDSMDKDPEEQSLRDRKTASPKAMSGEESEEEGHEGMSLDQSDAYEAASGLVPSKEDIVQEQPDVNREGNEETPFEEGEDLMETMIGEDDELSSPAVSDQEGEAPDTGTIEMDIEEADKSYENEDLEKQFQGSDVSHRIGFDETVHHSDVEQHASELQAMNVQDMADTNMADNMPCSVFTRTASTHINEQEQGGQQSSASPFMTTDQEQGLPTSRFDQAQSLGSSQQQTDINEDLRTLERLDANPYRSLGDALKEWKERVHVKDEPASDIKETDSLAEDLPGEGDEYEFVAENKGSSAQALGAATADQLEEKKWGENSLDNRNYLKGQDDNIMNMPERPKEENQIHKLVDDKTIQRIMQNKSIQQLLSENISPKDGSVDDEMLDELSKNQDSARDLSSYISSKWDQSIYPTSARTFSLSGQTNSAEEMQRLRRELEVNLNEDSKSLEKAKFMWSKYEQLTSRLSRDLTEQLRLIMEPTLATRLEGDYRTGKRINMKKVIPYIASQFRKDKIWLRRTKPNKRQYQVILAIDDSRSMSESHCGHMALEALITISRAMSMLEVGQVAVASFGKRGNVKLLHDFDRPFSMEAGVHMISQFSFKQDNTIADEPIADLLHCLTRMLDTVSKNASIASGRNNLQQLILIIADGRFHEKETLRRCIREAVSRRQMLAFIILDNLCESIMDVQSVSFTGGAPQFSKYIDTFPFPYYILLKDIEALPRTLVDLLRQWFELMQRASLH